MKFSKVKDFFDKGFWDKARVRDAVIKEWITAEEYYIITSEEYERD